MSHVVCVCVCWQHVGKSMSSSQFVSNLDGMNEGENFSKDLLKVMAKLKLSENPFYRKVKTLLMKMLMIFFFSIYILESL